jgi:hypothetical protein
MAGWPLDHAGHGNVTWSVSGMAASFVGFLAEWQRRPVFLMSRPLACHRVTHHLVGVVKVAAMLGVSRQRVSQLADTKDFPAPAAVLAAGPVWERQAVED